MEVNLALLIMSIGLVGILTLFPVGLRQGDTATSDTTESAFADLVLNAMRANAQMVTNWNDWQTLPNGTILLQGHQAADQSPNALPITVPTVDSPAGVQIRLGNNIDLIDPASTTDGYLSKGQYLRYSLNFASDANGLLVKAWIQVTNRRYTDVAQAPTYATSFVFMGM